MKYIQYCFFRLTVGFFALLPFSLLYRLSDLLATLMGSIIGYRSAVIEGNLKRSFPEKSAEQLGEIKKKFYRNLCDISLEAIKGFSLSREEILRRYRFHNAELMQQLHDSGQSFIAVAGHFTNWEWGTICGGLQFPHHPYGFYKPLVNKYIDRYLREHRARFRMELVSMADTVECFARSQTAPTVYIMVADQSPSNASKSYWIRFLNQDTACLHGPEKHARARQLPVYYIDIQRTSRGFYEFGISLVSQKHEQLQEGELTALFMKKLEQQIVKQPHNWLWSHRRWKKELPAGRSVIELKDSSHESS